MTINKKVILTSVLLAASMSVVAGGFVASAFARMDRQEAPGDNLDMLGDRVGLIKAGNDGMQRAQNILYEANIDYVEKKKQADALTPSSSAARSQKEELTYALTCYANAIDAYQKRVTELGGRMETELEGEGGKALTGEAAALLDPVEKTKKHKLTFGEKVEVFFTGKTSDGEEWVSPTRDDPAKQLINDINDMPGGALKQEIDNSRTYCDTLLKKTAQTISNDAEAARQKELQDSSNESSGTKSSGSSGSSGTKSSGSSGSSTRSSGSSGSSTRSSGSSGSSTRSSGSSGSSGNSGNSGTKSSGSTGSGSSGSSSSGSKSGGAGGVDWSSLGRSNLEDTGFANK